uniref:Uncharacterized protein n=1 Tax=Pararge aegeria TaxID=116150 RepID=S4PAC0_9NEOP
MVIALDGNSNMEVAGASSPLYFPSRLVRQTPKAGDNCILICHHHTAYIKLHVNQPLNSLRIEFKVFGYHDKYFSLTKYLHVALYEFKQTIGMPYRWLVTYQIHDILCPSLVVSRDAI